MLECRNCYFWMKNEQGFKKTCLIHGDAHVPSDFCKFCRIAPVEVEVERPKQIEPGKPFLPKGEA